MVNPTHVTGILALVVLGLGAYILFVDIPQTRQFKKQESQERQLLPFDDRAITQITWASQTETIRLSRDDKWRWKITGPIQSPADSREIRRILRALTIGKIKRHIEDGQTHLATYGLQPPYLTLTLKTPTETHEIALGDAGPFAPSLYVQTKVNSQVVLTTLDVMTFAQKSLTTFRLKDLLLFNRERVHELHIQHNETNMVVERVAGAHSLTPNWVFSTPEAGPADETSVGTLLMDLSGLKATGFIDNEDEKQQILAQPPTTHVSVKILEGSLTHQVNLYQFTDTEIAYAVKSSTEPWYEIAPSILRPLTQGLFYFQDKRLFGMEVKDLAMVEVETPRDHYLLIKQHGKWMIDEDPTLELNQEAISLFISRLVNLPAEISIPDTGRSSSESALKTLSATIRGLTRRGEEKGQLILGKREKGLVFAKGRRLPGLYQVRSTILNHIPTKTQLTQTKS